MTNVNLVIVEGVVTREARPAHTTLPWQWTFSMDAGDLLLPILFGKQDDTVGFLQETAASVTPGVRVRVRGRMEMKSDRVLAVRADHVETERRTRSRSRRLARTSPFSRPSSRRSRAFPIAGSSLVKWETLPRGAFNMLTVADSTGAEIAHVVRPLRRALQLEAHRRRTGALDVRRRNELERFGEVPLG